MILDMQNAVPVEGLIDLSSVFPFANIPEQPSQIKETVVVLGSPSTPGGSVGGTINQPGVN